MKSKDELLTAFNIRCGDVRTAFKADDTAQIFERLGKMVTDMRELDMDVRIETLINEHPVSVPFAQKTAGRQQASLSKIVFNGILHIGDDQHLFVAYSQAAWFNGSTSGLRLSVLKGDHRFTNADPEQMHASVACNINKDGIAELQEFIINQLAKRAVILECDTSGGLSNKPPKPPEKAPLSGFRLLDDPS